MHGPDSGRGETTGTGATEKGSQTRVVVILGLVSMFTDIGTEMVFAVLPLFLVGQLGVTLVAVGIMEGIAEATAALVKLGSGVMADRTGRPKLLALTGYGLSALVKPVFALAPGVAWIVAARWLDRVGKGIRGAPRDVLLAAAAPEGRRGRAFGLRQAFDKLGEAIGPLAAFVLLALAPGDFRLVLWAGCLPGLVAILLLALGVREAEGRHSRDRKKGASGNPVARSPRSRRPLPRVADLRRLGPGFARPLAVAALLGLAWLSDAFLLLRAQNVGLPTERVPLVLLAMNLGASAAAYSAGSFADTRGHRGALAGGIVFYAVACGLLALARTPGPVWAAALLFGLHLAFVRGNLLAWVSDIVPAHERGTALGWVHLVQGAALLPAGLAAGWLWQHAGPAAAFGAAAVLATSALPLLGRSRTTDYSEH